MNFDQFTGQIEHRLELPETGESVRAIRATLMTLGQRLPEGHAEDLAASLPMEIKWYLTGAVHEHGQRFDWREFVERVSEIEQSDPTQAAYHARVIVDFVRTLVPASDFQQLRDALPEAEKDGNWRKLFEVVDAGGWGEAGEAQTGGGPKPEVAASEKPDNGGEPQSTSKATFEVYEDRAGKWRWRLVHANGNIIADGGEGYASRQSCEQGLKSVKQNAPGATIEQVDNPTGGVG
ncbi:MAG: HVO_2922 family protein [Halobacteriales archaeon]|nr:HVO_2922 family protein [Halobacteriales archaeon]